MINIFIPGTKEKPKSYSVTNTVYQPTQQAGQDSLQYEISRRESVVRELARTCPFKPGDTAKPISPAAQAKWGTKILVQKICSSYAHLGKDEKWPSNDNPMIITAWSHDKKTTFFCTTNFLEKV